MLKFRDFKDYKNDLIKRILEREPGVSPNSLEHISPENYMDEPVQKIPLDKIDNMPNNISVTKHELEWLAKRGEEPSRGAYHGVRLGKRVHIPIAVIMNDGGTFSILDGYHRAVQAFIDGDKTI